MSFQQKTIDALLTAETEIVEGIKTIRGASFPNAARKAVTELKNSVGRAYTSMPNTDAGLSTQKKALVAILNVLGGLEDGLKSKTDRISRSDFNEGLLNLSKKFVPTYRQSVDGLVQKVRDKGLGTDGKVYETDRDILNAFRLIQQELKSAAKSLFPKDRWDEDKATMARAVIMKRRDYIHEKLSKVPQGKMLDDAVDLCSQIMFRLQRMYDSLDSSGTVLKPDGASFELLQRKLGEAIHALELNSKNRILTYTDALRDLPDAKSVKPVASTKTLDKIGRSPSEFLKDRVKQIKGQKARLPVSIKGMYSMVRCPVVAIFNKQDDISSLAKKEGGRRPNAVKTNFSQTELLKTWGIKHIMLEDYVILEDQYILVVDKGDVSDPKGARRRKLAKLREKKRKEQGLPKKKSAGIYSLKSNPVYLEAARKYLADINGATSEPLMLVSTQSVANPRNANLQLYWVMPTRILDGLMKRGWSKLREWNVPFELDASSDSDDDGE